ncbi:sulfite exporter TauE/SafE family protein [Ancylobacter novellus]|nr:sulfite exporter TauE/SafE family protein [Ancylobacter novellus]
MMLEPIQYALGGGAGVLVGFTLGLVGGGGSILAVPLMVYLVGVGNPHVAIGTSAFAVAINAAVGLFNHARTGTVKWRCGGMYAAAGVVGAFAGSSLGKMVGGEKLLFLFALLMLAIGVLMLRGRGNPGEPGAECTREKAPKVLGFGLGTGAFSGFFGIGGGFLIVPGLIGSTGMPILNAVGTSLVAVTAFGLTTAINYAFSGLVNWPLAFVFIIGGALGSVGGMKLAHHLAGRTGRLSTIFAGLIFVVATYMLFKSASALLA